MISLHSLSQRFKGHPIGAIVVADTVKGEALEGRVMRDVPTPKNGGLRRFICSKCMWNVEVLRLSKDDARAAFEMHDCGRYRRRNSFT